MFNSIKKSDFVFNNLCKICAWCGYHLLSVDESSALLRINTKCPVNQDPRLDWATGSVFYTYAKKQLGMTDIQISKSLNRVH